MEETTNTPPHIGQLLRKYVNEKRIHQRAWARHQGVQPHFISRYLRRPEMKISTLFTISLILKNNFLREIADMLPPEIPSRTDRLLQENENLKKENERLRTELELLKDILKR
jgi:hypothetical protein